LRRRGRLSLGTALASVSAVLVCAGLVSCKTDEAGPPSAGWLQLAPDGCAIGFSGPTLDPGDAIRYSRRDALRQLASTDKQTRIHIESELYVTGSGQQRGGEFTRQDIEGSVREARIVALWAERTHDPRSMTKVRHVYGMACHEGAEPPDLDAPVFPSWLLNVPEQEGRICAIGVGGPTYDPRDQEPRTIEDGRNALAEALDSRLHQIIIDTGVRNPRVASELETTEAARARAKAAQELDRQWSDVEGNGPLSLKGVLYGLVCIGL
jgi:hypothetical protein